MREITMTDAQTAAYDADDTRVLSALIAQAQALADATGETVEIYTADDILADARSPQESTSSSAKFLSADQNWNDETTVYWFALGDEQYGVADCNGDETIVDADGAPLHQGPALERVRAACVVTDAIRDAAAGFSTRARISDAQIRALSNEAGQHGDLEQVALCRRALTGDQAARAQCVRVIHHARAQE